MNINNTTQEYTFGTSQHDVNLASWIESVMFTKTYDDGMRLVDCTLELIEKVTHSVSDTPSLEPDSEFDQAAANLNTISDLVNLTAWILVHASYKEGGCNFAQVQSSRVGIIDAITNNYERSMAHNGEYQDIVGLTEAIREFQRRVIRIDHALYSTSNHNPVSDSIMQLARETNSIV